MIGFIIPFLFGHSFRLWTLNVSFTSLFLAFVKPSILLYPYKIWMMLGHILGKINSYVILGIVFVIVLQPIAFIMKLFGYDPLREKLRRDISYRENTDSKKIDFTRIF